MFWSDNPVGLALLKKKKRVLTFLNLCKNDTVHSNPSCPKPKDVDHAGGIADDDDIAASSVLTNAINDVCGGDFCLHLN